MAATVAAFAAAPVLAGGGGNGGPNGAHYNLNIAAVMPNNRPNDSKPSQRHTIIAPYNTQSGNVDCRINLANGGSDFDFEVVDGFCLDGDASFILPDPDPGADSNRIEYQVWLRLAGGAPGTGANLTTCAEDAGGANKECSTENTITITGSKKTPPKFHNVTRELLTLCVDTDDTAGCDTRVFLFDDDFEEYFWEYDNRGNRLAQLRFYPVSQFCDRNNVNNC
jgi:hypothetical protein